MGKLQSAELLAMHLIPWNLCQVVKVFHLLRGQLGYCLLSYKPAFLSDIVYIILCLHGKGVPDH